MRPRPTKQKGNEISGKKRSSAEKAETDLLIGPPFSH